MLSLFSVCHAELALDSAVLQPEIDGWGLPVTALKGKGVPESPQSGVSQMVGHSS